MAFNRGSPVDPCPRLSPLPQDVLKPGGGLGVGIPNWRYAWDARNEIHEWGHRWNTAPDVVCRLYHKYWSHLADLEQLNTMTCELGRGTPGQRSGGDRHWGAARRFDPPCNAVPGPVVPHTDAHELRPLSPLPADRLTFDFVLRKKGKWESFPREFPTYPTGRDLYCAGKFIGPTNMPELNSPLGPCP